LLATVPAEEGPKAPLPPVEPNAELAPEVFVEPNGVLVVGAAVPNGALLLLEAVEPNGVLLLGAAEPNGVLLLGAAEPNSVLLAVAAEPNGALIAGAAEPEAVLLFGAPEPNIVLEPNAELGGGAVDPNAEVLPVALDPKPEVEEPNVGTVFPVVDEPNVGIVFPAVEEPNTELVAVDDEEAGAVPCPNEKPPLLAGFCCWLDGTGCACPNLNPLSLPTELWGWAAVCPNWKRPPPEAADVLGCCCCWACCVCPKANPPAAVLGCWEVPKVKDGAGLVLDPNVLLATVPVEDDPKAPLPPVEPNAELVPEALVEPSGVLIVGAAVPNGVLLLLGAVEPNGVLLLGAAEPNCVLLLGAVEPNSVLLAGAAEPNGVLPLGPAEPNDALIAGVAEPDAVLLLGAPEPNIVLPLGAVEPNAELVAGAADPNAEVRPVALDPKPEVEEPNAGTVFPVVDEPNVGIVLPAVEETNTELVAVDDEEAGAVPCPNEKSPVLAGFCSWLDGIGWACPNLNPLSLPAELLGSASVCPNWKRPPPEAADVLGCCWAFCGWLDVDGIGCVCPNFNSLPLLTDVWGWAAVDPNWKRPPPEAADVLGCCWSFCVWLDVDGIGCVCPNLNPLSLTTEVWGWAAVGPNWKRPPPEAVDVLGCCWASCVLLDVDGIGCVCPNLKSPLLSTEPNPDREVELVVAPGTSASTLNSTFGGFALTVEAVAVETVVGATVGLVELCGNDFASTISTGFSTVFWTTSADGGRPNEKDGWGWAFSAFVTLFGNTEFTVVNPVWDPKEVPASAMPTLLGGVSFDFPKASRIEYSVIEFYYIRPLTQIMPQYKYFNALHLLVSGSFRTRLKRSTLCFWS
jgi:hypothetical protein